jgi:hypothetical protein
MRAIGQCEVELDLMCERALERKAFGKHLAEFANIQDWIAESRIEIDRARLLVLKAAHKMDREGNSAARVDVSAIKVVAARLQTRVVDRAMQVFGAPGLTPDIPLSIYGRRDERCAFSTDRMCTCEWYPEPNFPGRKPTSAETRPISFSPPPLRRNRHGYPTGPRATSTSDRNVRFGETGLRMTATTPARCRPTLRGSHP